jgi:hypothetical protein
MDFMTVDQHKSSVGDTLALLSCFRIEHITRKAPHDDGSEASRDRYASATSAVFCMRILGASDAARTDFPQPASPVR